MKDKNKKENLKEKEALKEEKQDLKEEEKEVEVEVVDPKDEEIENLKKELDKLKNDYTRVFADMDNLKKRLEQEAINTKKYRIQSFALEILPVIDNLERALASKDDKEDAFYKGVKMIYDQLIKSLENEGVKEIECLDKEFDPNYCQSIMVEKKEGVKANVVIEVLQKGYMLKDRVLRAALVKISE